MAGKITFKKGMHPSRVGGWVQPVKLTDAQLASLGNYVGRAITDDKILYIEDMLETVKGIRDADDDTRSQDVIETLAAIARADDNEVHRALAHCDEHTRAAMTDALRQMGEPVPWEFARFRPAKLKAAAAFARVQGNDGRRVKGYRIIFARAFVETWLAMTGAPVKPWEAGGTASRDVQAAQLLLEAIGDPLSLSPVAKLLRKVIA
ncbi:MAG TPA: hypothetical protein PLN31_19410 [Azoarcus taiwanensis]|nr:hypothetical protein [Azoarcus taiwanensis]